MFHRAPNILSGMAIVALFAVQPGQAEAGATYFSSLTFSLSLPGAITNAFGYSDLTAIGIGSNETGSGVADAVPFGFTSQAIPGTPPFNDTTGIKITASPPQGTVGGTGPGIGTASAFAQAAIDVRFGNLTGSGTGVPGQTLNVPLTVAYNFNIGTSADNPQLDSSLAEFGIIISANVSGTPVPGPTGWNDVVEIVTNGQVLQNSGTANLLLSLPPSTANFLSVTDLDVQLFIDGAANSVVVPVVPAAQPPEFGPLSVPEPASVWLFASGLFGLLSASMLTRRPRQSVSRRR